MKGEPDTRLPSRSAWASHATAAWSQPCWALETVAGPGYRRGPPKGWNLPCVGPQGARGTPGCAWEPGSAWPAVDGALSLRAGRCACVCYVKHEDALQGGSTEPPWARKGPGPGGRPSPRQWGGRRRRQVCVPDVTVLVHPAGREESERRLRALLGAAAPLAVTSWGAPLEDVAACDRPPASVLCVDERVCSFLFNYEMDGTRTQTSRPEASLCRRVSRLLVLLKKSFELFHGPGPRQPTG